jgi:hypothetical protein
MLFVTAGMALEPEQVPRLYVAQIARELVSLPCGRHETLIRLEDQRKQKPSGHSQNEKCRFSYCCKQR